MARMNWGRLGMAAVAMSLLAVQAIVAMAAEVDIQIGYENNPGEPIDLACREWKRLIELESGGSMKVQLFPSSQLGSKNELIDQILAGDSIVTVADGAFYAERGVPDFSILMAPYLFENWDQCWKLLKSDWWREQCDKLERNGLKLVAGNWIYGERHTLATRPIRKVADLKGMKIRVANSLMYIAGFEALGATPTPLPLGEVYTALQQGVVEGLENPLPVLYAGKYHEVAKHLTLDGHIKNLTSWVCGSEFFASLAPDQRRILLETGEKAGLFNNKTIFNIIDATMEKFKAEGIEIIEVDVKEFQRAAMSVYANPEVTRRWTPGLYERVKKALE